MRSDSVIIAGYVFGLMISHGARLVANKAAK